MKAVGMLSDDEFDEMNKQVKEKLKKAMAYSEASPSPDPSELETDVFAPSVMTVKDIETEAELRKMVKADSSMRQISYAEAIQEALREEMKRDAHVFIPR